MRDETELATTGALMFAILMIWTLRAEDVVLGDPTKYTMELSFVDAKQGFEYEGISEVMFGGHC